MGLRVKYTLFADYQGGGYLRTFDALDYVGISGKVESEKRGGKLSVEYYVQIGQTNDFETFTSESEALKFWEKVKY